MSNSQYTDNGAPTMGQRETPTATGGSGSPSQSGSLDAAEEEEQEDPSSSDQPKNIEEVLTNFRNLWHKEIANEAEDLRVSSSISTSRDDEEFQLKNLEDRAKQLFLKGVENEQKGRLYEAIQFYKKAVQLVPDIEFRLYDSARGTKERTAEQLDNDPDGEELEECSDEEGDSEGQDLTVKFQNWLARSTALCVPAEQQKGTHISSLPMEILLLIFRWVVSRDLDIRSLEMCSMVSRGFYLCSRDSEIWRLVCLRLWGVNCGGLTNHLTWREMYVQRPHLNFTGCYISKTTYVRHGENSFQDQFYRPWHVVEYYRYIRFFPEGRVLMMTTPDGPAPMLAHLRSRNAKYPAVIVGHYRVTEDLVTLVLRRDNQANNKYRTRQGRVQNPDYSDQTYNIALQILPWKSQRNCKLAWNQYRVLSNRGNTETVTNFDILNSKFPPFWFSRVKSYCNETEHPLS